MKKSIYLFIIIFSIGYNIPTKSALTNAWKNLRNYSKRFIKKLWISKKTPKTQTRAYTTKFSGFKDVQNKISTKAKETIQKSAPYAEKFSNLIHGYGFKSTLDIFFDAFKENNAKNMEYALQNDPSIKTDIFFEALKGDKVDLVEFLLSKYPSITNKEWSLRGSIGLTSFEVAVWSGNFGIAKLLLEKGASTNRENSILGGTALTMGLNYLPILKNNETGIRFYSTIPESIKFLVNHGVNINQHDYFDFTPLMIAAKNGENKVVKTLIEYGADVNATTGKTSGTTTVFGIRASHIAKNAGHLDTAELLDQYEKEIYEKKKEEFLKQRPHIIKD